MGIDRQAFMNTYVSDGSLQDVIEHVENCIQTRTVGQVITLNVDQVVRMEWDEYFKEICDNCELLLVDGQPLMWISQWYRSAFTEKISGSDLVPLLCALSEKKGYSVFFLGAASGVAEKAKRNLLLKHPQLNVVGTYSPPFGFEKNAEELAKINKMLKDSKADMLFVGLGVPKQDVFIYENKETYQIPMSFSVGGTIDFLAGVQKRAPKWMSNHGLEWFYRLLQNPRRLVRRYLVDDVAIFKLIFKYRPTKENELV